MNQHDAPHPALPAPGSQSRLRAILRRCARWSASRLGAGLNLAFGRRAQGAFGILMYHRIAPRTAGLPRPTYNVTPDRFRWQIEGLLRRGYRAWPLAKLLESHRAGGPIPERLFAVTFDDGYANLHEHAWPALREMGVPATVFVATAYVDRREPFPFDDWALRHRPSLPEAAYRPLCMKECEELLSSPLIDLGTHTHTHADFRNAPDAFREDLLASLDWLRARLGLGAAPLAFPFGYGSRRFYGSALSACARACGVTCAVTSMAELVRPESDRFDWGRFGIHQDDTPAILAAMLDGWYSLLREARLRCWPPAVEPARIPHETVLGDPSRVPTHSGEPRP